MPSLHATHFPAEWRQLEARDVMYNSRVRVQSTNEDNEDNEGEDDRVRDMI